MSGAVQVTRRVLGVCVATVGLVGAPGLLSPTAKSAKLAASLPAASTSLLPVPVVGFT